MSGDPTDHAADVERHHKRRERLGYVEGQMTVVRDSLRLWAKRKDTPERLREDMRGLLGRLEHE